METQHYALLDDAGRVTEPPIAFNPEGFYAPEIVARFRPCPEDTRQGAMFDPETETFTNSPLPPAPEPADPQPAGPTYRTLMTPIRFKAQFSVQEQVAIKRARAYQGEDEQQAFARDALDILFGSLDDPRLSEVDVADPSVIGGIDFVASLGILTAERADTIKLGLPA